MELSSVNNVSLVLVCCGSKTESLKYVQWTFGENISKLFHHFLLCTCPAWHGSLQFTCSVNSSNSLEQNEKSEKGDGKEMPVFLRGFKQCITDATKFFRDVEELDVSEGRCFRLIQHLKRQISRYESKEKDMSNGDDKDRLVWDSSESSDVSNRRTCGGKLLLSLIVTYRFE